MTISSEQEYMEQMYQEKVILDYACEEGEDGSFYWVQRTDNEWVALPTYMETNRRESNGS